MTPTSSNWSAFIFSTFRPMTLRNYTPLWLCALVLTALPLHSDTISTRVQPQVVQTKASDNILLHKPSKITAGDSLTLRLNHLLDDPLFDETQVGIFVYDLTVGRRVYAHHERQRMRPASCQKLVTAITALHTLGTNYQYHTDLFLCPENDTTGKKVTIYLRAGYDPLLDHDDLKAFATALQKEGIERIEAPLILDCSLKDEDERGWGWCWDDKTVPLTPLLYKNKDRFVETFREVLAEKGIEWDGRTTLGTCPDQATRICQRSHTIDQILLPMMKESDNSVAESLFYQLAAKSDKRWAGRKQAVPYIKEVVKSLGLNPRDYLFADGSGLSLYNYTSAELLGKLLIFAYDHPEVYRHLLPSLPVAGEDGTLERRMRGSATRGNVKAKTGTVEGVSTLAGYCTNANGHTLCFAILNQGVKRTADGRDFQDKVCNLLCE